MARFAEEDEPAGLKAAVTPVGGHQQTAPGNFTPASKAYGVRARRIDSMAAARMFDTE
jgi:hypothetical protein